MRLGWGTITCKMYDETALKVDFDCGGGCYYHTNGKENNLDKHPTLFWDEIKFEIPEKPFDLEKEYRKLERKEFVFQERNYSMFYDFDENRWGTMLDEDYCNLGGIYFENNLDDFTNLLNEHNITPKQLNEIIRKVEREEE